mmetsp:Transcript_9199/g.26456  ORF Transcript_9199/g.26456 Transcript_9199/m.26456 type:complete len:124 (+) Transcript_9199:828-1199(+)
MSVLATPMTLFAMFRDPIWSKQGKRVGGGAAFIVLRKPRKESGLAHCMMFFRTTAIFACTSKRSAYVKTLLDAALFQMEKENQAHKRGRRNRTTKTRSFYVRIHRIPQVKKQGSHCIRVDEAR